MSNGGNEKTLTAAEREEVRKIVEERMKFWVTIGGVILAVLGLIVPIYSYVIHSNVTTTLAEIENKNKEAQKIVSSLRTGSAAIEIETFPYPRIDNVRLDWCQWSLSSKKKDRGCGEGAANAFCRKMGYAKAVKWDKEDGVGDTICLEDEFRCEKPHCGGFAYIRCSQ